MKPTNAKEEEYLHPLIQKRWSPRAFSNKQISDKEVQQLFNAARWAASANNEQPWIYAYALKNTPGFDKLWNCLAPGNQPWTKSAAVLIVTMKRNNYEKNGKLNLLAEHDLGLANSQLILQAMHQNIFSHFMAGFDKDKIKTKLTLEKNIEPVCMLALGYLGNKEQLVEPYKSREGAPRNRKSIQEFITKI